MPPSAADCVIVGGGIIGSASAYFLARDGRAGRIVVIEPDPTYQFAATPYAAGGLRRLFSRPENILMSQASAAFYGRFAEHMAVDGEAPELNWRNLGYLFLAGPNDAHGLAANADTQRGLGVDVRLLDAAALRGRYPAMATHDVALAALSPEDGCLDPNAALQGFRRKARSLGVEYLPDRVSGLSVQRTWVSAVHLASGATIAPQHVICAAGTWSAEVAAMAGMELPLEPMQRHDHYYECATDLGPLPFIKDLGGLGFHQEGRGFTGSLVNHAGPAGHNWSVDHDYFEAVVWPALAARIPAFETLKLGRSWVAHYDRNRLDGNMILGNWPGHLDNLFVACGFSGHGVMHAPAVGQAMAELVLDGFFSAIDLSRMGYGRVVANQPYPEHGIK